MFVIEALGCFALNELALCGLSEIFTHLFLKQNRLFRERKRRLKWCDVRGDYFSSMTTSYSRPMMLSFMLRPEIAAETPTVVRAAGAPKLSLVGGSGFLPA